MVLAKVLVGTSYLMAVSDPNRLAHMAWPAARVTNALGVPR